MQLRVISGSAKGRKLKSVPGDATRPIMDRVKEALFNIIAGDAVDSKWWDLFAGTGAVGIEALSRGAAFVRFSDLHLEAVKTITWNVEHCGFVSRAEVLHGDAIGLLSGRTSNKFDYIYIAPPQYKNLWLMSLNTLDDKTEWLAPGGWVIVQIDPSEYERPGLTILEEIDQRKYGKTLLVFYSMK